MKNIYLNDGEEADGADVADRGVLGVEPRELVLKDLAHLARVLNDLVVLVGVDARNRSSAADRVGVVTKICKIRPKCGTDFEEERREEK